MPRPSVRASFRPLASIAITAAASVALQPPTASAASYYWGGSVSQPAGASVSGYWSDAASNPSIWSNSGSAPVSWNNDGTIDAFIGNAAVASSTWAVTLGDSTAKAYAASAKSVAISVPNGDLFSLVGQGGGKGATLTVSDQFRINSPTGAGVTRVTLKDLRLTGAGSVTIDVGQKNNVQVSSASAVNDFDYTGSTTLKSGNYQSTSIANGGIKSSLGKSSSAASNLVFDGGTYTFAGTTTTTGSTDRLFTLGTGGGTLTNTSATGRLNFTNTGSIAFEGAGPRTLTLGGASTAIAGGLTGSVFSAALHDQDATTGKTSINKTGNGTWTLIGSNSYTGDTTVSAGTLLVNGSIASTVVLSGTGSLGGSGTTGPVTVGAGSTISIGTLKSGPVTFGNGSSFAVEVGAAGNSDTLQITGSLDLSSLLDTLKLTGAGGFDGSDYTLATFTAGTVGTDLFNTVTLDGNTVNGSGFSVGEFTYAVTYTDIAGGGGSVQLVAIPEPASFAILSLTASLLLRRKRATLN